jgi:hypothetical protein
MNIQTVLVQELSERTTAQGTQELLLELNEVVWEVLRFDHILEGGIAILAHPFPEKQGFDVPVIQEVQRTQMRTDHHELGIGIVRDPVEPKAKILIGFLRFRRLAEVAALGEAHVLLALKKRKFNAKMTGYSDVFLDGNTDLAPDLSVNGIFTFSEKIAQFSTHAPAFRQSGVDLMEKIAHNGEIMFSFHN